MGYYPTAKRGVPVTVDSALLLSIRLALVSYMFKLCEPPAGYVLLDTNVARAAAATPAGKAELAARTAKIEAVKRMRDALDALNLPQPKKGGGHWPEAEKAWPGP